MSALVPFVPTKPGQSYKRYPDWLEPPTQCDACGGPAIMVKNSAVYRSAVGDWPWVYFCLCCEASVGCHPYSVYPKGKMAGRDTGALRQELHRLIDPKWQGGGMSRDAVYGWLGGLLGMPPWERAHIGHLGREECLRAITLAQDALMAGDFGA